MKKSKKLLALVLVLALGAPSVLTSCSDGNKSAENIWVTDALELVEQDKKYEGEKRQVMNISLGKGEYEGAQLQLHADKKIVAYDVTVSDLYSENAVIPKEDIELYAEKYVTITAEYSEKNPYGQGSVIPDALIPFDTIKEYGENFVEEGLNQGVYLEVKTYENTVAGNYTGTITVTVNGVKSYVPLNVQVWDFVVPAQNEMMNFWGMFNWADWGGYEMDCSMEMATAYFEFLLEHRVCSDLIPHYGFEGAEAYVETIRKYWNHTGFNSYRFYYEYSYGVYDGIECWYDGDKLREYLVAVAKAGAEDRQDYLSKTYFYFSSIIDEPHGQSAFQKVEKVNQATKAVVRDANEQIKAELFGTEDYGFYVENIENTLLEIPNLITTNNAGYYPLTNGYDVDCMNYCISVGGMRVDPNIKELEQNKGEAIWTYSGMGGKVPMLDFGLEAYRLQGRLLGWSVKARDLTGYLNWAASIHNDNAGRNFFNVYTKDRVFGDSFTTGDGWIIYPGRPYEIYGPVASLRLKSFRDSMEDVAYLELFSEYYEAKGLDAKSELEEYYEQMIYEPTGQCLLLDDTTRFNEIRCELGDRIEKLNGNDIWYGKAEKNNNIVTLDFSVADSVTGVEYEGKAISPENGVYTVVADLGKSTEISLVLIKGDERKTVTKSLSGTFKLLNGFNEKGTLIKVTGGSEISLNTDPTYSVEGNSLKILLKGHETDNTFRPGFYFNVADLGVDVSNLKEINLSVYSEYDGDLTFNIYTVGANGESLMKAVTLTQGWNVITIEEAYYILNNNISAIRIRMPENITDPAGRTIYVDHFTVKERGGK